MPYTFADFQAEYTLNSTGEHFASEVADVKIVTATEAGKLFPHVALSESPSLVYFPFRLCHSLPSINRRGRCFTGPVLARSFATAVDSLIDMDHMILANNLSADDKICGHIKATKVEIAELATVAEMADVPATALPVYGLGCLYLRAQQIKDVVTNHIKGNEKWSISMECGHNLTETAVYWDGRFIPLPEAEESLLRCIKPTAMLPWREKPTALSLGGTKGAVDFWGAALTRNPADGDASIFHFVGAKSREAASTTEGKNFYMPLRYFPGTALEVANVEAKLEELASISVLGNTDEADGHTHIVLNDMTILPAGGHVHYVKSIAITPGTKPTLTGVTDPHQDYARDAEGERGVRVHQHTINIPLNKKNKGTPAADTQVTLSEADAANLQKLGDIANMAKNLTELLADLNAKVGEIAALKDATAIAGKQAEIATIQREIAQINSDTLLTQRIDTAIADQIKAGTLLRKEVADTNTAAAVKVEQDKATAEKVALEKKAARLESVRAAGIDPTFGLPDLKNADQSQMTIADVVNGLAADEVGERQFTINLASWKAMLDQAKKAQGLKDTADQQAAQQAKEAANAGVVKKVSESIILAAGAGSTKGQERANGGRPLRGTAEAVSQGRSRFNRFK